MHQFHLVDSVLSDGVEDEDVENSSDTEGKDRPDESHDDHHLTLHPFSGESPGVSQEDCQDPDSEADQRCLPQWGIGRLGYFVVMQRESQCNKSKSENEVIKKGNDIQPVSSHEKNVEDDTHFKHKSEILQIPVVRIDVGYHGVMLEDLQ